MIQREHLQLLLSALSMKSKSNLSESTIYERYKSLMESGGESALVELWSDLESIPHVCDWPEHSYEPEMALKKRALILACQVVKTMVGNFPKYTEFEMSDDFQHLVMHGKLGLMALLFSLQESQPSLKTPDFSPMVEKFMTHIETSTEELLFSNAVKDLAKALGCPIPESGVSLIHWIRGRLQPFAMMRSVYLEEPAASMSPLEWWVAHERYIPALPEC
jgi:hypothetical protein